MESLRLQTYLDLIPLSAIILTTEHHTLSSDSLKLSYINTVFLDIIDDGQRENDHFEMEAAGRMPQHSIMSILQERCINPSPYRFMQWIEAVTLAPNSTHLLKTRFKGFTPRKNHHSHAERTPQLVDIEWNAVVMHKKYIVLTGRTTGTVQYSSSVSSELLEFDVRSPPPIEEGLDSFVVPVNITAASSSSASSGGSRSRRTKAKREVSSITTLSEGSRMSSFTEQDDSREQVDKWHNNEKVFSTMSNDSLSNRWLEVGSWGNYCARKIGRKRDWDQLNLGLRRYRLWYLSRCQVHCPCPCGGVLNAT
jgi:hypothetical protein